MAALLVLPLCSSCYAARWPPQYAAAPWPWLWPFDLEVGVGVACDLGYTYAKFRLPRPFGFRVRAHVRDIRRTDGQTDADDRLMPPPPLRERGHNKRTDGQAQRIKPGARYCERRLNKNTFKWKLRKLSYSFSILRRCGVAIFASFTSAWTHKEVTHSRNIVYR